MSEWVYLNDGLVPADEARISVFDAGLTHAAGLFETMRVYRGKAFRLGDHLDRMAKSAAVLEMQLSIDRARIEGAVSDLLLANGLQEARLRLTVTAGNIPRPGMPADGPQSPTVVLTATPPLTHPPDLYKHGMRVCICPYRVNRADPLAGHKTLAYLPRLLAMKDAAGKKCHEALWFNTDNQLAEASVCNVFIVHDGKLMTPPVDTPILPGILRKAVLEMVSGEGVAVEERAIDIETLLAAKEVFLTGSITEIMPVTAIEKHQVGEGAPGEVTGRLRAALARLVEKECVGE
jgi:D-amino acid aminotransferase